MDKLKYVVGKLKNNKTHAEASFRTGISIRTFFNIIGGKSAKPHQGTIDALFDFYKTKGKK